jgi:transposase, IS6 family
MSVFKRRRFPAEIVLLCVRWYCRYGISYRDLEEMMDERGVTVDHLTLYRRVQRYAPELEKRVHTRATAHRPGALTRPTSGWAHLAKTAWVRQGTPGR